METCVNRLLQAPKRPVTDNVTGEQAVWGARIGIIFRVQAAVLADGASPADVFAQADEQGVVFVEQAGVKWQIRREELLVSIIAFITRGKS